MKTPLKYVWLIDDNEIDNFINRKILLKVNFSENVKDFNSATAAENAIENIMNGTIDKSEAPEVIFLDLNMPITSGHQFLITYEEKLRQLNPTIKVVILSSSINPNDAFASSLFPSFHAFINKPLTAETLNDL